MHLILLVSDLLIFAFAGKNVLLSSSKIAGAYNYLLHNIRKKKALISANKL